MEVVDVNEAKRIVEGRLGNKDFELIDVRSPMEYDEGHIKGSILLPLNEIEVNIPLLDKNKDYLVYCKSGGRSAMASQFLEDNGFKITNVRGGISDWIKAGFKIEKN